MDDLFRIINSVNDWLWTYVVIVLLVFCAIYFTFRIRGVQFRLLKDMWRVIVDKPIAGGPDSATSEGAVTCDSLTSQEDNAAGEGKIKKIGSFQAFAVSLSSRVGTGNLAGVASAICVGGPGAVFWMWIMALFGAATAFIEATLAQLYKRKGKDSFYGGPAYYMQHGLHRKWMGLLFAVLLILTFGIANQLVQSNTLCDALGDAFSIDKKWVGIALAFMTVVIIFGGIHRISHFASIVVPFMAIGYVLIGLVIIVMNINEIPSVFALIFKNAFGIGPMAGGMFGTAVMQGVKRGLFSNEAGEGSAPNAAAIAHTSHPVKQGLLQSLGVFTDTIVVCSCTAFIILLSGIYDSGADGIILTKNALECHIGKAGGIFLTAAIFLFAYSTLIGNYFYAETNIRFITGRKSAVFIFRIISVLTIIAGAVMTLQEAWSLVDITMGVMTIVNLVAIIQLAPKAFRLLDNYMEQRRAGKDPVFRRDMMPGDEADIECWD